jgi:hypothetical protein
VPRHVAALPPQNPSLAQTCIGFQHTPATPVKVEQKDPSVEEWTGYKASEQRGGSGAQQAASSRRPRSRCEPFLDCVLPRPLTALHSFALQCMHPA